MASQQLQDAWTQFFQSALNAVIAAGRASDHGAAALEAALYADKAYEVWLQKMNQMRPNN